MRWSSSSCRMLLQMSLNSFSTCVKRHGTDQTRKIRLRERPRRATPGAAPGGVAWASKRSVAKRRRFLHDAGCPIPSRSRPTCTTLPAERLRLSERRLAAVRNCIPLRRCSARRLSQVPARVGAPRTHPGLPDALRSRQAADARHPHGSRLVVRRGGSKSRQPALNRRSGPGGRGTDAEGSTSSLGKYASAGRAHTSWRYFLIRLTCSSLPLESSFCSMEEMILHEARRAPMTFL